MIFLSVEALNLQTSGWTIAPSGNCNLESISRTSPRRRSMDKTGCLSALMIGMDHLDARLPWFGRWMAHETRPTATTHPSPSNSLLHLHQEMTLRFGQQSAEMAGECM